MDVLIHILVHGTNIIDKEIISEVTGLFVYLYINCHQIDHSVQRVVV